MTGSQLALASLQGSDSIFGRRMSREQIVHSLPRAGIDNEQMRSCGILFGCDILDLMQQLRRSSPATLSGSQDHLTLRFSADDFPRLLTISSSTCWPSLSVDRP